MHMDKEKLLTIVIPTYNMEAYLHRSLDSLIVPNSELLNAFEVLVINDGSKDSSSMIAHEYESKYPNTFRVVDKENGNYGSCLNRGIDEAKGVFFKILDADDWYDTQGLTDLLVNLKKYVDLDAIFTEFVYHDINTNSISEYRFRSIEYGRKYEFSEINLAGGLDECMLKMYSITVKTDILRRANIRMDTGISYTDNEYMYFLYSGISRVIFLNISVYQYFVGREGQTVSPASLAKHINDMYIVTKRMLDDYVLNRKSFNAENVIGCKEHHIVMCGLVYFNESLELGYDTERNMKMKELYQKIKSIPSVKGSMLKKSPFFMLWAFTGLYKSSALIKPLWNLSKCFKK